VNNPRYLNARARPVAPKAQALRDTLQEHASLQQLTRLAQSHLERLSTVKVGIPKSLHGAILAGGLDEGGWTLLARNAAAAAKLRQLRPHLQLLLQERFGPGELRIKLMQPD
jgi:hypothetical protein